jgi:hypothetical protein
MRGSRLHPPPAPGWPARPTHLAHKPLPHGLLGKDTSSVGCLRCLHIVCVKVASGRLVLLRPRRQRVARRRRVAGVAWRGRAVASRGIARWRRCILGGVCSLRGVAPRRAVGNRLRVAWRRGASRRRVACGIGPRQWSSALSARRRRTLCRWLRWGVTRTRAQRSPAALLLGGAGSWPMATWCHWRRGRRRRRGHDLPSVFEA